MNVCVRVGACSHPRRTQHTVRQGPPFDSCDQLCMMITSSTVIYVVLTDHRAALNPVGIPIVRWVECVDMKLSPQKGTLHQGDKHRTF